MQIGWVLLTLLVSVLAAGFTYVLNLANAMCTVPRRLSRGQFVALLVPWLCGAGLVAAQLGSAADGEALGVLLWNSPSVLLLLAIAAAGLAARLADHPAAQRRRRARREAAEQEAMTRVWQQHGRRERFDLRVEVGLPGHYPDERGSQREGIEWRIRFTAGGAPREATVRSFGKAAVDRAELLRHARHVLDGLEARVAGGWSPASDAVLCVEVGTDG